MTKLFSDYELQKMSEEEKECLKNAANLINQLGVEGKTVMQVCKILKFAVVISTEIERKTREKAVSEAIPQVDKDIYSALGISSNVSTAE